MPLPLGLSWCSFYAVNTRRVRMFAKKKVPLLFKGACPYTAKNAALLYT
jgi:hypothetical protein